MVDLQYLGRPSLVIILSPLHLMLPGNTQTNIYANNRYDRDIYSSVVHILCI